MYLLSKKRLRNDCYQDDVKLWIRYVFTDVDFDTK